MKRFFFVALIVVGAWSTATASGKTMERVICYPSVDQDNRPVQLSGKLSVPQDQQPKGIILLPHFTIGSNKEAPSNRLTKDAQMLKDDYVLIMPDYLGYGISRERAHPYLHGELTARNTVDMYLYTRPILDSLALGIPTDSIYIVGYSQGGATALWTLRLIEEQYTGQIYVKHCFVGSAPCDVATTYDEAVLHNRASVPALIPLLTYGTNEAYRLNLAMEEILDFDRTLGDVLQWAAADGHTLVVVTADHATGALTLQDGNLEEGRIEVAFGNDSHNGIAVPYYVWGPGSDRFGGILENAGLSRLITSFI